MNLYVRCVICNNNYISALTRQTERQETRVKEMKDKYEKQLSQLRTELKQLQLAKKEHSKAIRRNVSMRCNEWRIICLDRWMDK